MSEATLPPACILVGGRGTRLGAITDRVPKPMLVVAGRPFIEWPLIQLRDAGFQRAVLCVGYLGGHFQRHLGDGAALGIRITYSDDGDELLGPLGALRNARELLDDVIPVLYGDTYLKVDFGVVTRSHAHSGDALTMTVLRNMGAWDGSNCRVVGDRVAAYAKNPPPAGAEWIDYGFSVYSAEVLAAHDEGTLEGLVGELASQGEVRAWPVGERFYEIGSKEALAETEGYLASSGVTGRRPEARLL